LDALSNKRLMRKLIILSLIFSIFATSCGAKKVNVDKVDVKVDSTLVVKQETTSTQDNHISITENTDELEVCPVSDTIPMVVNGITYKNAKLRYKKAKKVLVDTSKIKVSEKASIKVNVKKTSSAKAFKKEVDRKAFNWWWLLIILLVVLGFYTYKRINRTLF
jgi:hypothetical protein